jgi:hypothetical protein
MLHKHILLPLLTVFMLTLAGCLPLNGGKLASTTGAEPPTDIHVPTQASTGTRVVEFWQQLDLRYAQVLAATYELPDSSQVRFNVTLVHDDDGEAPYYTDWWQVEDLSGNVLGKRVLTHTHGSQPFTRSVTFELPAGVDMVIICGQNMRHGFGGQAIHYNLETGVQVVLPDYPYSAYSHTQRPESRQAPGLSQSLFNLISRSMILASGKIFGSKSLRQEFAYRGFENNHPIGIDHVHFDIRAELGQHLTARAAGRPAVISRHCNGAEGVMAMGDCLKDGITLCADRHGIHCVLDIHPVKIFACICEQRCSHLVLRIGSIRLCSDFKRALDQFSFILWLDCHACLSLSWGSLVFRP